MGHKHRNFIAMYILLQDIYIQYQHKETIRNLYIDPGLSNPKFIKNQHITQENI